MFTGKNVFFLLLFLTLASPQQGWASTVQRTVLSDDLDGYDWQHWFKADWSNGDPFYNGWCPDRIAFASGTLTISLIETMCHDKTHASGEYRTIDTYGHGRYSVRLRASDVNGTISSFFTYTGPSEGTEWDEIDVEILGKDPTKLQVNYWRNGHEHPKTVDLGFDASAAFHTYTFLWHEAYIAWYVDDVLVHRVTENGLGDNDSLPVNPGRIMINLWAATGIESWSGSYVDGTEAEATYDFIRYESIDAAGATLPALLYLLEE